MQCKTKQVFSYHILVPSWFSNPFPYWMNSANITPLAGISGSIRQMRGHWPWLVPHQPIVAQLPSTCSCSYNYGAGKTGKNPLFSHSPPPPPKKKLVFCFCYNGTETQFQWLGWPLYNCFVRSSGWGIQLGSKLLSSIPINNSPIVNPSYSMQLPDMFSWPVAAVAHLKIRKLISSIWHYGAKK